MLKVKVINSVKWTSFSASLIALIQLAQIAILARYLSAEHFGLMALVSVVIGFANLFVDLGVSGAVIHRKEITSSQFSSLFWLNIFLGCVLSSIIYFMAPVLSIALEAKALEPIIKIIAFAFIFSALGNLSKTVHQKKLNFKMISVIEMVSVLLAFILAVSFAMKGFGVYSLVYSALFNLFFSNVLFFIFSDCECKPRLHFKLKEIREFISFGLYRTGAMFLNYIHSKLDIILIGKLLGTEVLGAYSLAKNLIMRPAQIINPIITKVLFPVLAKVQESKKQVKKIYLSSINLICSINFPIYLALFFLAEPIVTLMLGNNWNQSIVIFQILSFCFMFRCVLNPVGALQLAMGKAKLGFYWNTGLLFIIPIAILIGLPWHVIGVSWALTILQIILIIPSWILLIKPLCGATFYEYIGMIIPIFVLSIISAIIGTAFSGYPILQPFNILTFLVVSLISFVLLSYRYNTKNFMLASNFFNNRQ